MNPRPGITYCPQRCPFLRTTVWAILAKQQDGSWRIVNCLDKHNACLEQPCAFTQDSGQWPFAIRATDGL